MVLLATSAAAAAIGLRGHERQPARLVVGVTANALDDDMARTADRAKALGVSSMREELRWQELEPRRGPLRFERFDRLVDTTARRGIRVLPILIGSPAWSGSQSRFSLPVDLPAWQGFVRKVVRRYGPGGDFWKSHPELDGALAPAVWEIWNEPYYPQFSPPAVDPGAYARLVRATVQAGRSVSAQTRYLTAADLTYLGSDGAPHSWMGDMQAAVPDIGRYVDALAIHPYTAHDPFDPRLAVDERFTRFVEQEAELRRLGIGSRPLWITELGWATCPSGSRCNSDAEQARYWQRVLAAIRQSAPQVRAVFAYRLSDLGGDDRADPEQSFGLLRRDGTRKPAWEVFRRMALGREG